VAWLVIISVPVLYGVQKQLLSLSSLERRNLVPKRSLLLLQGTGDPASSDCPHFGSGLSCEAHCYLGVVSVPHHKNIIDQPCSSWIPR
jgi:hypothetical protein